MDKLILVAEDDENISEIMKIILEEEGYTVETAKKQGEIESSIKKRLPHLIFLDVRLGGESGEEIALSLKSNPRTAAIPLIIVSADQETKQIASRVGANGFLLKPFDITVLSQLVKDTLS